MSAPPARPASESSGRDASSGSTSSDGQMPTEKVTLLKKINMKPVEVSDSSASFQSASKSYDSLEDKRDSELESSDVASSEKLSEEIGRDDYLENLKDAKQLRKFEAYEQGLFDNIYEHGQYQTWKIVSETVKKLRYQFGKDWYGTYIEDGEWKTDKSKKHPKLFFYSESEIANNEDRAQDVLQGFIEFVQVCLYNPKTKRENPCPYPRVEKKRRLDKSGEKTWISSSEE
jgi:hypothetical protein